MTDTRTVHPEVVSYLEKSREIIAAAEAVADALDSGSPPDQREREIDSTVDELNQTIARTSEREKVLKGFSASTPGRPQQPLPIEDQLTIAVADATVASVLFAASGAVGEQAAATGAGSLRRVVRSANADLLHLQPAMPATQKFGGARIRRFSSDNPATAAHTFQTQAKEAVGKIIDISDDAVSKSFKTLARQKDQILEAFAKASDLFDGTSDNAILIRKAWEKLLSALHTIRQIAASAPFQQAEQFLCEVSTAASVRNVLQGIFQSSTLMQKIDGLQVQACNGVDQVDMLSSDVAALAERFAKTVSNIRSITAVAVPLLSLSAVHFAGPFAPLAVPACYSLSMVAIIVLGLDFTHSGLLNSGTGIGKIMDELQRPLTAS